MDECSDVESKVGAINIDTDYIIQGLELFLNRLKEAHAGGWKMPNGDENKAFSVTMDETKCTNEVEQHLFRRIFAIAAYKEAKKKVGCSAPIPCTSLAPFISRTVLHCVAWSWELSRSAR